MSPRVLLCLIVFTASIAPVSVRTAEAAAATTPAVVRELTEDQKTQVKELDADIARSEQLIASVPDAALKELSTNTLNAVKVRLAEVRTNFDPTRFDEIRFEVLIEHQRLARWAANPTLTIPRSEFGPSAANTLSEVEKAAGWELLFDGRSYAGWRGYRQKDRSAVGWKIEDGMLRTIPAKSLGVALVAGTHPGQELITERKFTDFEFSWEWRIASGGNSGVKYFVTEDRPKAPGHEYQMADDAGRVIDRTGPPRETASFYDVVPTNAHSATKPAGEWNVSRIVVRGTRVEHWLNAKKVAAYELGSPEVKAGLARSKFKDQPGFGQKIAGHVMLTYHDDECWFRNLKVREFE